MSPGYEFGITGVTATGDVGSGTAIETIATTGVASTGNVGTVIFGRPIVGVSATGNVGSVAMGPRTVAISGVSATGELGVDLGPTYWQLVFMSV